MPFTCIRVFLYYYTKFNGCKTALLACAFVPGPSEPRINLVCLIMSNVMPHIISIINFGVTSDLCINVDARYTFSA